jgi:hypothetical protein
VPMTTPAARLSPTAMQVVADGQSMP